jgi:flagella basal body P-ring formation protein FlgA
VLTTVGALAGLCAAPARTAVTEDAVREAIVRAVEHRVGPRARVEVRNLVIRLGEDAEGSVFASLPSEAKAGTPARVVLKVLREDGRTSRFGEATCVVDVLAKGFRATRPITRGTVLEARDVEALEVNASGWALRPLPREVEGARAVVDIAAGQVLQQSMVAPAPLVRTGDEVTLTLRRGPIVVEGRGVAAQAGRLGDVIPVVNPNSKRRIAGRVTGRGSVEVEHDR